MPSLKTTMRVSVSNSAFGWIKPLTGRLENAAFVYAIIRASGRFNTLREMVETSAKEALESHAQKRKQLSDVYSPTDSPRRSVSGDGPRSPMDGRPSRLGSVAETQSAFAIGDDEESDEEDGEGHKPLTSQSSNLSEPPSAVDSEPSRAASISSPVDDAVPQQLRGMSEKARGKLPANHHSFSRNSSTASLSNAAFAAGMVNGNFEPTQQWVSQLDCCCSPLLDTDRC